MIRNKCLTFLVAGSGCLGIMMLSAGVLAFSQFEESLSPIGFIQKEPLRSRFTVQTPDGSVVSVGDNLTGGRGAEFSKDGRFLAFKWVGEIDGLRLQAPAILDLDTKTVVWLHSPVALAGNPRFSDAGKVLFTIGDALHVMSFESSTEPVLEQVLLLPAYCNTIAIHPNGQKVALTDSDDRLAVLDVRSGSMEWVQGAENACYPEWSPDGKKLAFRTIDGKLFYIEEDRSWPAFLGLASEYSWLPDGTGLLVSTPRFEGDYISHHAIVLLDLNGDERILGDIPELHLHSPTVAADQNTIRVKDAESRYIYSFRMNHPVDDIADLDRLDVPEGTSHVRLIPPVPAFDARDNRSIITIRGVPFQHQVYCTPAAFNGHWACNGTAAVMAIAYYDLLSYWDFVASTPFAHTSHWGRYVSQIYTYNGYTFNTGSPDAGGNTAYGAYGYIVKNDWEDTKTFMKEYIQYHGLGSSVDWSPAWAELQAKTASRQPFVLLSSITSSGHYKTVTGYISGQHTAYFNDPYGNKNQGYMNFNGAGVAYDWPGYNNGYQNLNTVWCYIYADGTPPSDPPGTADNPIAITSFPFSDVNSTRSSAGQDVYDYYSCAPSVNESGRELVYMLPLAQTGTISATVVCDQEVDIDLHLLSDLNASSCLARAHASLNYYIATPGTYYLTCDTFVAADNLELMGDYTLNVSFSPDVTPTPATPTATPAPAPVPVDNATGIGIMLIMISIAITLGGWVKR